MTPSLTLLVLDTPNRKPVRPRVVASDITTARAEVGVVRGRAIRGRRPVETVATLIVVSTIIPVTVASKRHVVSFSGFYELLPFFFCRHTLAYLRRLSHSRIPREVLLTRGRSLDDLGDLAFCVFSCRGRYFHLHSISFFLSPSRGVHSEISFFELGDGFEGFGRSCRVGTNYACCSIAGRDRRLSEAFIASV